MNQLRFKKAPVFGSLPNCSKKKLHLRSKMAGSSQSMIKALFIIALYILSANVYSQKIKIAYVGNSITIAHHIPWGEPGYEAYSDISAIMLNQYFGNIADIQNFGNGGKTLVDMIDPKTGLVFDGSYMRQSSFTDALKFAPDICFISLGTNDGTTSSWPDVAGSRRYVKEFYGDYLSMIDSFKVKNPNTKIIVCYPPPVFGVNLVYDDAMAIKMRPEIDKVIATSGSDSLDWHTLLKNKAALFSNDRIHPLVSGSALMGKFAFEKLLRSDLLRSKMSGASLALNKPVAVSSFIGSNDGIKAVDLDQASYWEANISGQQWISTDLGLNYDTKILRLVWGESLSKNYSIQVSDNNTDWTTIKTITGDTSRVNVTMNLTGSGRYVRLLLTDLAGASFKLKEFEVFGNLHLAGVDFTKLGGIATAQYSSDSVSGPEKAIDAFADTKFMTANKSSWLE